MDAMSPELDSVPPSMIVPLPTLPSCFNRRTLKKHYVALLKGEGIHLQHEGLPLKRYGEVDRPCTALLQREGAQPQREKTLLLALGTLLQH